MALAEIGYELSVQGVFSTLSYFLDILTERGEDPTGV
jgi:hypothetical protein